MKRSQLRSAGLEIRLLGRLEILRDGETQPLPASKKSRALLAYLVATGRHHLRERLCELLWEAPDDPRASLRWSLAKMRPLVDDAVVRLVGDRDELSFETHGAVVDLTEMERDLAAGASVASIESLRKAAAAFRGDFLDGLDLMGCYRYHEWWIGERERTRALRVAVLSQLSERLRDHPEEALDCARQLLAVDPLSEAAHVRLIRLLGEMGRTREAIAQYERCKRVLAAELGTQPSADLQLARMNLSPARQVTSPPPAEIVAPPRATVDGKRPPLIGRHEELDTIAGLLRATVEGSEHGALTLLGEPGIGKTRMLEELADRILAAGGLVLSGRAFEAETVRPYGPWIDALRSISLPELPTALREDLLPLLPELATSTPAAGDRNRLFDAVTRLLLALTPAGAPCLVVLDDLQWFDEASAALLHFAARAMTRSHVLLAFGARPSELHDNPVAQRLLRSLGRERTLVTLELGPLDTRETADLVRAVAAGVDGARVFGESEGNPFFALEIARALGCGEEPLSKSLEQLIGDRFERVGPHASALLPWAAALGRSFRSDALGKVAPLAAGDLLSGIEELERRGILRSALGPDGAASYDFSHDLIREAAYRQTSEARKRLLHLQIARALAAATDPSGASAADVAHHAALGGDDELCVRACITAGKHCIGLFANAEAQALADRGRQRLDRLAVAIRIPLQLALLRLSVEAGMWRNCARELESELTRAVVEAQSAGLQAEVVCGWELLSEIHEEQGNMAKAHDLVDLSEQASRETDAATKARAIARAGRCLAQLEKEMPRAEALLEEARQLSSAIKIDLPDIPMGLGLLEYQRGDYDAAERLLEQSWRSAARQPDHWIAYESLSRLVMVLLERRLGGPALEHCGELDRLAAKLGEGSEAPFAATLHALACLLLGQPGAHGEIENALAGLRRIDTKGHLAYALNFAAELEFEAGELTGAKRRAEEALRAADTVGRRTEIARARSILSRVALAAGDLGEARAHIESIQNDVHLPLALAASARNMILAQAASLGLSLPAAP